MIPKIIHYCWLSNDPIPAKLQECMNSWGKNLYGYEFMLWNFERFDISSSIWVKQAFEAKKYAFAADFIRIYAVYHYGGIYLDMDVEVIKSFDDLLNYEIMMGYESIAGRIEAASFGAKKNHPFMKKCLNYYDNRKFIKSNGRYDTKILPEIMKRIYDKNLYLNIHLYPAEYFSAKDGETGKIKITENTYTIHHFENSWCSKDSHKQKQERLNFYERYGNDEYVVNLYTELKNYKERAVENISLRKLYGIVAKRTIKKLLGKKIYESLKKVLKNKNDT
jgi:hypothetical protein